jgi:hypothetical protein
MYFDESIIAFRCCVCNKVKDDKDNPDCDCDEAFASLEDES